MQIGHTLHTLADPTVQVLEFVAFGERLARSHTRAAASAEAAAAKLRAVTASLPVKPTGGQLAALTAEAAAVAGDNSSIGSGTEAGKLGGLRHNDDLSLRPGWLPPTGAPARLALVAWWDAVLEPPLSGDSSCAGLGATADSTGGTNKNTSGMHNSSIGMNHNSSSTNESSSSAAKNSSSSTHSSSGSSVPWWQATGAAEGDDAVQLRAAQVPSSLAPR